MRIQLNETHVEILRQVIPDLLKPISPLAGNASETLLVLTIIEWHKKNIAKMTYCIGFKSSFSDAQAYAMAILIQCTVLPDEHDAIEFGCLFNQIAKKLPTAAFKKDSKCNISSLPHYFSS